MKKHNLDKFEKRQRYKAKKNRRIARQLKGHAA